MIAKPKDLPGLSLCVRDFGTGPCLATLSHGATIVLMADRKGKNLVSCYDGGLLSAEAALPILERICEL